MPASGELTYLAAAAIPAAAVMGAVLAWGLYRRSQLSAVNLYLVWLGALGALAAAIASRRPELVVVAAVALDASTVAAVLARRWRLAALGAGGELRQHELGRR